MPTIFYKDSNHLGLGLRGMYFVHWKSPLVCKFIPILYKVMRRFINHYLIRECQFKWINSFECCPNYINSNQIQKSFDSYIHMLFKPGIKSDLPQSAVENIPKSVVLILSNLGQTIDMAICMYGLKIKPNINNNYFMKLGNVFCSYYWFT